MEITQEILTFVRIIFYAWVIYEVGTISSVFYYLHIESPKDRFLMRLSMFLSAICLFFFFSTIIAFISNVDRELYKLFINSIVFPSVVVALSARTFRKYIKRNKN